MHRIRIRFAKKDLVAKGVQNGVKPFCALMGLLCIALGEYLGKDTIQYSYSADTRDAMGAPNARYNCVCSFQDGVTMHEGVRLEEFVQEMDAAVKASLTPERSTSVTSCFSFDSCSARTLPLFPSPIIMIFINITHVFIHFALLYHKSRLNATARENLCRI